MRGEAPSEQGKLVRGRYEVVQLLGRGGFGATYLVKDKERFDTPRALKELIPSERSAPKVRELFEREARTLMELAHERIPAMHAFFDEDDRYFLVQDFVPGETLEDRLDRHGPLPEDEVTDILRQVLDVLEYLHGRVPAVLHRDIKPSNLIRDEQGRLHLIDFGAVREAVTRIPGSKEATVIGTAGYAPLEQIIGRPVAASDLYALGATALHLLTGRPPVDWHDIETGELRLDGRLACSERMQTTLTSLLADLPQRPRSVAAARTLLPAAQAAAPPTTVPTPARQVATEISERSESRPAAAATPPRLANAREPLPSTPSPRPGRVVAWSGAGVGVLAIALWATLRSEAPASPESAGASAIPATSAPAEPQPPTQNQAPREALPLLRVASTLTPAGLTVQLRYPDGWQVISQNGVGYVAVRDPATQLVFLAGIDEIQGEAPSAGSFAERWRHEVGERFATVRVLQPSQRLDDASVFRLEVVDGTRSAAPGTLSVSSFAHARTNRTAFQWWASLRNDEALIPTLQAMVGALAVADPPAPT